MSNGNPRTLNHPLFTEIQWMIKIGDSDIWSIPYLLILQILQGVSWKPGGKRGEISANPAQNWEFEGSSQAVRGCSQVGQGHSRGGVKTSWMTILKGWQVGLIHTVVKHEPYIRSLYLGSWGLWCYFHSFHIKELIELFLL